MRPTECPECGEMFKAMDLTCSYCGTIIETDPNNVWQTIQLSNGNKLTIYENATTLVQFLDGRKVSIHDNGTMSAHFPDGRLLWMNEDGTTEVIDPHEFTIPNLDWPRGKQKKGRPII